MGLGFSRWHTCIFQPYRRVIAVDHSNKDDCHTQFNISSSDKPAATAAGSLYAMPIRSLLRGQQHERKTLSISREQNQFKRRLDFVPSSWDAYIVELALIRRVNSLRNVQTRRGRYQVHQCDNRVFNERCDSHLHSSFSIFVT